MHLSIARSTLAAACVAATAAAFSAASAQAAVTASTLAATSITADSATLNGAVATGGAPVIWEFTYNLANNRFAASYTSSGGIGPGISAPVAVLATATNLTPSTTYTYQLVATNVTYGLTYYLNSPVYGTPPLSFKTKGPGSASLKGTKLTLKGGRFPVVFTCTKALACDGGVLALTTRYKGKKLACASATFSVGAGQKKTIHTSKVSKKCKALLVLNHKIKATLRVGFTYQKGISKSVSLLP